MNLTRTQIKILKLILKLQPVTVPRITKELTMFQRVFLAYDLQVLQSSDLIGCCHDKRFLEETKVYFITDIGKLFMLERYV